MQKDAHVVLARVVIGIRDVRQPDADVVDQCLVLQRVGDHSHALCEVALLERRAVPGEDKRYIFHLFLLHAAREVLQDPIVKTGLFLSVKQFMDVERDIFQVSSRMQFRAMVSTASIYVGMNAAAICRSSG